MRPLIPSKGSQEEYASKEAELEALCSDLEEATQHIALDLMFR